MAVPLSESSRAPEIIYASHDTELLYQILIAGDKRRSSEQPYVFLVGAYCFEVYAPKGSGIATAVGFVDDNRLEHSGSLIKDNVLDSSSASHTAYKILLDALIVRDEYVACAGFKVLMPVILIRIGKYDGLLAYESLELSLPCHFHCSRSYDKTRICPGNRNSSDTLHSLTEAHIIAIETPLMLNHVLNPLALVVKRR